MDIVTHFHGKALAAVVELVEAVVARRQGKRIWARQQHATVGRAMLLLCSPRNYIEGW
jgi:hypothetical protein